MASNFTIQNFHFLNAQVSKPPPIPSFSTLNFISNSSISPRIRVSITCCASIKNPNSIPLPPSDSPPPPDTSRNHSYEVSYLIKKFGWTPQFAISKARYLNFKTPEKPEIVVNFLKSYGFTDTQIVVIIKKRPRILQSNPDIYFLPKFEYLRSLGFSESEIINMVVIQPRILNASLENTIVPAFNMLSSLLDSRDEAIKMSKRCPMILLDNLDLDSVKILRGVGVPDKNILESMKDGGRLSWPKPDILRELVREVKEMQCDPRSMIFIFAVRMIDKMSKSTWEDKVSVFKKYGWSDHEIHLVYRKNPKIIWRSKEKIERVMDFLVNKMGIEAIDIANYPNIFAYSLEKRIIPRCLVYQTLLEKGLKKNKFSILSFCNYSDDGFITKVLKPHENEAPEIFDMYEELLYVGNDL